MHKIIEITDRAQWDHTLADGGQGLFFQTSAWLSVIEKSFSGKAHLLVLQEDGSRSIPWPFVEVRKGGLKIWGSPLPGWMTPHISPALSADEAPAAIDAVSRYLKGHGADHVELGFPIAMDAAALRQALYETEPCQTLMLDLSGPADDVWKNKINGKCRNLVRKAQKLNVEVRRVKLSEIIGDYCRMSDEVYAKSEKPSPVGPEFYAAMAESFDDTDLLWTMAAYHEGRMVAAAIFPNFGSRVYYLSGVSGDKGNELSANNLIQWELIQLACGSGKTSYDMVGANIPSIARFKASFGSQPQEYTIAHRSFSVRARLGRWMYKNVRPALRRMMFRLRTRKESPQSP